MKFLILPFILFYLFSCKSDSVKKVKNLNIFRGGDNRIRLIGRFDLTDSSKPKVWAPGAYFELDFEGSFCEINITDQHKYFLNHNYIEVVLDRKKPRRIKLKRTHNKILIGALLKDTRHHLLVCKNTESAIGYIQLKEVTCKKLLPLNEKNSRIIEFIGNSITCGNGSDQSQIKFGKGKWYDYHNAYLSFGPIIARRLDADWILSAVSGIGLTRSCCGNENTMPQVYNHIAFNLAEKKWNFHQKKPQVICVTLGQNDGLQKATIFVKTYLRFLQAIRKRNPKSTIICCSSQMANDRLKRFLKVSITKVVALSKLNGDNNIYSFFYKKSYTGGYKKHPTVEQHRYIASELGDFIKKIKNW